MIHTDWLIQKVQEKDKEYKDMIMFMRNANNQLQEARDVLE